MNTADTASSIVKEITINAPAQRVFDALTDPKKRVQWWGSEGRFQATQMESDLRPGGQWNMRGTAIGNHPFVVRGEYRAVDPPRILEFTWIADWHENEPGSIVRFELNEKSGVTTVRLTHWGFASDKERETYQGWPLLLKMLQKFAQQNK
jgi:uncharacterized protein YndB with AHSA1/START domain